MKKKKLKNPDRIACSIRLPLWLVEMLDAEAMAIFHREHARNQMLVKLLVERYEAKRAMAEQGEKHHEK